MGTGSAPDDPHRDDQNADWAAGRMVPMLCDWDLVRALHDRGL